MLRCSQKSFFAALSQHPETFGISNGLKESLPQLLLGGVFWEQQRIKAGVRGWQPEKKGLKERR